MSVSPTSKRCRIDVEPSLIQVWPELRCYENCTVIYWLCTTYSLPCMYVFICGLAQIYIHPMSIHFVTLSRSSASSLTVARPRLELYGRGRKKLEHAPILCVQAPKFYILLHCFTKLKNKSIFEFQNKLFPQYIFQCMDSIDFLVIYHCNLKRKIGLLLM